MFKFILKRILMVIPTFIAITFVTFALIHFIPGDPVEIMMGERGLTPEVHQQMMKQLGLDLPLYQQYFNYIGNVFAVKKQFFLHKSSSSAREKQVYFVKYTISLTSRSREPLVLLTR